MSSPQYQTPEQLIAEIKTTARDLRQKRVWFLYDGGRCCFYRDTHEVEISDGKSPMTLEQFGERYKAHGLTVILQKMQLDKSIIDAI